MVDKEAEQQGYGGVRRSRESRKRDGPRVACGLLRPVHGRGGGQDDLQATAHRQSAGSLCLTSQNTHLPRYLWAVQSPIPQEMGHVIMWAWTSNFLCCTGRGARTRYCRLVAAGVVSNAAPPSARDARFVAKKTRFKTRTVRTWPTT